MMNRKNISDNCISFEDFATTSQPLAIGDCVEVPMTACGSVAARYQVISVSVAGAKILYQAERTH